MNEDFTTDALQYLLEEMEPARRAAFADRLASDPVAAAAFKTCADNLATFALESASAAILSEADQRASLAAILAQTAASAPAPRARIFHLQRWSWPVAAALLFGFNIFQGVRLMRFSNIVSNADIASTSPGIVGSSAALSDADPARRAVSNDLLRENTHASGSAAQGGVKGGSVAASAASGADGDASDPVATDLAHLNELRQEYARLQRAREALGEEYDLAIEKLARRALTEQGVGRLATMELVDADSYARGDRRGLMNLARGLLTEPGIVSTEPIGTIQPPGSTPVTGDSLKFAYADTTPSFTFQSLGVGDSSAERPGDFGIAAKPSASTYAWSVYDEKQNQGYLNLYNLPAVTSSERLQVWVKPVDGSEFRPVAEVPAQYYGKSGSVHYQLPPSSATPSEILITLEPRTSSPPTAPTGKVILRGP
ncbi:MAG: anti-sigma factor [Opitutaceae bacterium]|nr:anti-sigma factor [Opitutaceae bacterium]